MSKDVLRTKEKKNGLFRTTVLGIGRQAHFARQGKVPCLISVATRKKPKKRRKRVQPKVKRQPRKQKEEDHEKGNMSTSTAKTLASELH